jgi:hypothetical protein
MILEKPMSVIEPREGLWMEELLEHLATCQARAVLSSAYKPFPIILRLKCCSSVSSDKFFNGKLMMQVHTEEILCSTLHVTTGRTMKTTLAAIYCVTELHHRHDFMVQ